MLQLIELTANDKDQYNRFVQDHPSGDFLQSWEWGQWQEQLGHSVYRFLVKENEQTLLSAQVIETTIPRLNKSYLYVPYGPLLTQSGHADLIIFFVDRLQQKFPKALFLRLEPKQQLPVTGRLTPRIQPGKTLILDLRQTADQLLAAMHPKTRYNIKVAEKHGVRVVAEPVVTPGYGLHLQEAVDLIVNTAKKQNFKSHSRNYYKKLIDFFGVQAQEDCTIAVYKALRGQQLLATAVLVDFGSTRTYLFGGTSDTDKNAMAPYALHWQAIRDAQAKKLTHYDWWGVETASGKTPGFVRFKLGWRGSAVTYPAPQDIVWHPAWYTIYNVLRRVNRKLL